MEAPSRGGRETRRRECAPGRAPGVVGGPLRYLRGPPGPRRPTWGATAGGGREAGCESGPYSLGAMAVRSPGVGVGPWSRELPRVTAQPVPLFFLNPYYRIRPTEAALGPFSRQPRRQGGLPRLGHGAAVAEASPRRSDATRTAAARLKSHIHASKCYFHPFCVAAAHESTRKRARVDRVIMGEPPLDGVTPQRPVRAGRPSRGPSPRPTRAPQTASSPPRRRGRTV